MKVKLDVSELAATFKIANYMAEADGIVDEGEFAIIFDEISKFGVSEEVFDEILAASIEMDAAVAIKTIEKLGKEEKKYVSAFLVVMMIIDEELHETEIKLLHFVSTLCELPMLSIDEAVEIMETL
ncbi:MAG: hypothetical protein J6W61_05790 [Bacteroidales bacterium]|nr:hypothetical protein [Bacteroidales bacterium]